MGNWISDNKGQGPWNLVKSSWSGNLGPWPFTKSPNRTSYNEGNRIANCTDPVWPMTEFSGVKITETHDPCGYFTKNYIPFVEGGVYLYSIISGGVRKIRKLAFKSYKIVEDVDLLDSSCLPGSSVGVVRKSSGGREEPYVDSDFNIYLMCQSASAPYKIRVIRFNLKTKARTYLEISVGDNASGFLDGYVHSALDNPNCIYFVKYSAFSTAKIYVVDVKTFAVVYSYGVGYVQPGFPGGILVSADYDRIYCLSYRYDPFYTQVVRWKWSDGSYISTTSIAAGNGTLHQKAGFVWDQVNNYVYYLSGFSSTLGSGNGRLVRFSLLNLSEVYSIILPNGIGNHLCINSACSIAYVMTTTYLYQYSLPNLSLLNSVSLGGAYSSEASAMHLDEAADRVYLMLYPSTFRAYDASALALIRSVSCLFGASVFAVRYQL